MGAGVSLLRLRDSALADADRPASTWLRTTCAACSPPDSMADTSERSAPVSRKSTGAAWAPGPHGLPRRLLDMRTRRVVETDALCDECASAMQYAFVSHVWGSATAINETKVGGAVTWPVPLSAPDKLTKLLHALAPLVSRTATHFVWIDVLCIEQTDARVNGGSASHDDDSAAAPVNPFADAVHTAVDGTTPGRPSRHAAERDAHTDRLDGDDHIRDHHNLEAGGGTHDDHSIQAPLVPLYLRRARHLFVWIESSLGTSSLHDVEQLHARVRHVFPTESHPDLEVSLAKITVPEHLHATILQAGDIIKTLFHDPWFSRIWTLQEGALPVDRTMVSASDGFCNMDQLLDLARALRGLVCSSSSPDHALNDRPRARIASLDGESIYWLAVGLNRSGSTMSLPNAMWSTRYRDTACMHDRVVGLLGVLALPTEPQFEPDFYRTTSPQDCLCAVYECIPQHLLASMLNFRGNRGQSSRYPFLPSIDPDEALVLPSDDHVWAAARLVPRTHTLHLNGISSELGSVRYLNMIPALPSEAFQAALVGASVPPDFVEYVFGQCSVVTQYIRTPGLLFGVCEITIDGCSACMWWATDEIIDPCNLRHPDLQLHVFAWHRHAPAIHAALLHVSASRDGRRAVAACYAMLSADITEAAAFHALALDCIAIEA